MGYLVHSILVAFGLAAAVAASPVLFETIRWLGICYLLYLACKLIRSALSAKAIRIQGGAVRDEVRKGFLTAVLNPKGMMVYIAILPQFIAKGGNVALQASLLSATFIVLCAVIYSLLTLVLNRVSGKGELSDKKRRLVDGGAGAMILGAASFMATR